MNDDFDDLDRALFALPLETSPAGLREAIFGATIYRRLPAPSAFKLWETCAIGVALAVAAWLAILSLADRSFSAALTLDANLFLRELGEPATLAWFATGASLAILVVFSNFNMLRPPVRNWRA